MSKRGIRIPDPIREFVREQKRIAPDLTHSAIGKMVESKFGVVNRIDRSSVRRILKEGMVDAAWPTIQEKWPHGILNNGEILREDATFRWSTGRPQQVGDGFILDLGEEIPTEGIRLLQGTQHLWDHPKRWNMTISDSVQIIRELGGAGLIEVKLGETLSVRIIGVEIVEPRLPTDRPSATCWAVDNIEIGLANWKYSWLHSIEKRTRHESPCSEIPNID